MKKTGDYHEFLIEGLKDPEEAATYLNVVLEEGDPKMFLVALRNVAEARGGMSGLARNARLNRANLYRILSKRGNPEATSLNSILKALGLKLLVGVDETQKLRRAA